MSPQNFHVAIIGAGLSGIALALSLHKHSISCSLYEAREAPLDIGGALMMMPNGLKALDKLGVQEAIRKRGYTFDNIYFYDAPLGKVTETVEFGSQEKYGVRALRIYRSALLQELFSELKAAAIPVYFNRRFSHIVSESECEGVVCQFTDGSTATASLLVGADGIHSSVRKYVAPDVVPIFTGGAATMAAVPTSQLELPSKEMVDLTSSGNQIPLPAAVVVPKHGAFVIAPQVKDGSEVLITVQRPVEQNLGKEGWREKIANKEALAAILAQNAEHFPPIVRNAVRDIPRDTLNAWPFYEIPRLDRWMSKTGGVLILGDSAHALPPSAGQGVNQAFEDVYTLGLTLGRLSKSNSSRADSLKNLEKALLAWQAFRQTRIDHTLGLNRQMDLRRMPASVELSKTDLEKSKEPLDFDYLYKIDYDMAVDGYMRDIVTAK